MREKLIELVCEMWHTDRCVAGCNYPPCYEVRFFVDNLIANGVTIQKWIPVTERLPEKHDRYLVLTPSPFGHKAYTPWLAWYEPEVGFIDSDPEYGDLEMDDVTHWMPLPEPPKGE